MTTSWPDTHLDLEDDDQETGRRAAQLARVELIGYERAATRITEDVPLLVLARAIRSKRVAAAFQRAPKATRP